MLLIIQLPLVVWWAEVWNTTGATKEFCAGVHSTCINVDETVTSGWRLPQWTAPILVQPRSHQKEMVPGELRAWVKVSYELDNNNNNKNWVRQKGLTPVRCYVYPSVHTKLLANDAREDEKDPRAFSNFPKSQTSCVAFYRLFGDDIAFYAVCTHSNFKQQDRWEKLRIGNSMLATPDVFFFNFTSLRSLIPKSWNFIKPPGKQLTSICCSFF